MYTPFSVCHSFKCSKPQSWPILSSPSTLAPRSPVFHAATPLISTGRYIDERYQAWPPRVNEEARMRGATMATREDGFRALDFMGIDRPSMEAVDLFASMLLPDSVPLSDVTDTAMSASSAPPREPTPRENAEQIMRERPERFYPAKAKTPDELKAEAIELAEFVKTSSLTRYVAFDNPRSPVPIMRASPSPPPPPPVPSSASAAPPMQRANTEPVRSSMQ